MKKGTIDSIYSLAQSAVTDSAQSTLKFLSRSGIQAKITRTAHAGCCEACAALAGSWVYGEESKEIYRRHKYCTCTVSYDPGNGRVQNVHSKIWTRADETDKIKVRKTIGISKKEPGLKKAGAATGALNDTNDPDGVKRDAHAELYYAEMRKRNASGFAESIYKNIGGETSGFSKNDIRLVYEHIFTNKHLLDGKLKYFDSDYDIAQSFQRLLEGTNIREHDLILLEHERMEAEIMQSLDVAYETAHEIAEEKYNYKAALIKYLEGE